jgi:hypothetical protein
MTQGPWRLLFKNSNNNNEIIAELTGDASQSSIKQARWKTRNRGVDKLSLVAGADLFKSIPREENNDFGTSEPGIFWQSQRFVKTIQSVDTTNDTFTVSGDVTNDFEEGGAVTVKDSTRTDDGTIFKVKDPSDATFDSNNNETTITVVEDVTDSTVDGNLEGYENIFRGYPTNQGKITESGDLKLTLLDFLHYIGAQEVNISSSNTIDDVASKLAPSDYTYDSPDSSNVVYIDSTGSSQTGYAPVDNYSLNNTDRGVGFRELVRNFGFAIKAKANKEIRFEPVGFGGSIDIIDSPAEGDTNNTRGNWKTWTAGDTGTANVVNVARVVNSKGGTQFDSGVVTNSTSVNKYGKQTPKGGLPVKKSFVDSDKEAKRVAENLIRDSQNPTEGGKVKVAGRFTNNVSNSSFTLNDSVRQLDSDVFVCWSQVNFYPENKSVLEFQFENQDEREADITDDVRAERSVTFSSTKGSVTGDTGSTAPDVGGDTGSNAPDVGGDTGSNAPDVDGETGDDSPNVSGTSDNDGGSSNIEGGDAAVSTSVSEIDYSAIDTLNIGSTDIAGVFVHVEVERGSSSATVVTFRCESQDDNDVFPNDGSGNTVAIRKELKSTAAGNVAASATIFIPQNVSGEDIDVQFRLENANASETGWDGFVQFYTIGEHGHGSGTYDADLHPHTDGTLDTDNHPHTDGTLDTDNHPHTDGTLDTDNHPHQNGTLEADQTGENKTDR